jgi:predicted hotdog family 3-hydroxylacyl-ACP dehydratase
MNENQGYQVTDWLPHGGAMVLIDEIVAFEAEGVRARATPRADGLFTASTSSSVPAWLGMEYLAQAIAAWSGFHERRAGRRVKPGLLVGTRTFTSSTGQLPVGERLEIAADRVVAGRGAISVFDGSVHGTGVEQRTRIKVVLPEDIGPYL